MSWYDLYLRKRISLGDSFQDSPLSYLQQPLANELEILEMLQCHSDTQLVVIFLADLV